VTGIGVAPCCEAQKGHPGAFMVDSHRPGGDDGLEKTGFRYPVPNIGGSSLSGRALDFMRSYRALLYGFRLRCR
jgi:hypothetical protein